MCCFGVSACYSEEKPEISFKIEYFVKNEVYHTGKLQNGVLTNIPQNPNITGYVFDGWFLDDKTWEQPLTVKTLLELPLTESDAFKVFAKLTKYRCDLNDEEHSFAIVEELKSSCTERGYKLERCNKCGYEKNTILQPLQHDYINEITKPSKCNEEGVRTYTCTRDNCNHFYTQPIAALQHDYLVETTTQPTCTTKGIKTYTCLRDNCNHSYTETINELQHSFTAEETIRPCVTDGLKTYSCSRENCNYCYTEVLPALGYHDCDKHGNCIRCLTQNVCSQGFEANGDTLTSYKGNEKYIIIPSMFEGVLIKNLEYTFLENEIIESVYIPNTVEHIGVSVFDGCSSLKYVRMSSNLKVIDSFAFTKTAISSVWLPKTITNINMYAFYDCSKLTNIYYEGSQEDWSLVKIEDKNTNLIKANITYDYTKED